MNIEEEVHNLMLRVKSYSKNFSSHGREGSFYGFRALCYEIVLLRAELKKLNSEITELKRHVR